MRRMSIRGLPDDVYLALKARATERGRSLAAEVREIIADAVQPEARLRLGTALWELGRAVGLTEEEAVLIDSVRDLTPAEPMKFDQ